MKIFKHKINGNLIVTDEKFHHQDYEFLEYRTEDVSTEITLKMLKEQKLKQVQEKSNEQYQAFVSKYPDVEQKSFEKKAEEAYKVSADRTLALTETRYLTDLTGGIENSTIELRNALADAVSAKTIAMAQLETWGVLKRDEIANCTTIDELNLITI